MSQRTQAKPRRYPLSARKSILMLGILVVLALIFFGVGGWHFSGQIESGALWHLGLLRGARPVLTTPLTILGKRHRHLPVKLTRELPIIDLRFR